MTVWKLCKHFFGRVYAIDCLKAAANAGVDVVVLCDTNGGTMPWKIEVKTGVQQLFNSELNNLADV